MAKRLSRTINNRDSFDDIVNSDTYDFMQLYDDFIKKYRGKHSAKIAALNWLESERKSPSINFSMDVRKYNGRMESGKIYTFNYNPKLANILSYYDKNPIVLALGPSKKYPNLDLGINLNFLPPKYKLKLMDFVYKSQRTKIKRSRRKYNKIIQSGKTPNPIRDEYKTNFIYSVAKRIIPTILSFAIRSYYVQRRSKTIVVTYNRWPEIAMLELSDMEGISLNQLFKLWIKHLKKNK